MSLSCVPALGSSPAEDSLLRLVPANAEIVAGIQDPHHGDQSGRLLIVTHNNNVDLKDWIGLVGVDGRQEVDRLIEVAMSSPRGDLSEHLLLARGSFDGRRILEEAQRNGGVAAAYKGVRVVNLKPFAREQKEMRDTRWLAILNDNTAVFGTPIPVMRALDRYVAHSTADAEVMKRVSRLAADVNCWSILTMPGEMVAMHMLSGVLDQTGAPLARGVTSVSLSIHYGSKERVDFLIGTDTAEEAEALTTAIRGPTRLLAAAGTLHSHLESVSARGNEVRGAVRVTGKEFDPWLAGLSAHAAATTPKEVAQAGMR